MLWLIIKGSSHQIISCNMHQENGKYQLWVERPNGKSMKISEDESKEVVQEVKDAIDFAIKSGDPVLELA